LEFRRVLFRSSDCSGNVFGRRDSSFVILSKGGMGRSLLFASTRPSYSHSFTSDEDFVFNILLVSAGGRIAWGVTFSSRGCRRCWRSFWGSLRSLFLFEVDDRGGKRLFFCEDG